MPLLHSEFTRTRNLGAHCRELLKVLTDDIENSVQWQKINKRCYAFYTGFHSLLNQISCKTVGWQNSRCFDSSVNSVKISYLLTKLKDL